jgi:hypothetical protein
MAIPMSLTNWHEEPNVAGQTEVVSAAKLGKLTT